MLRSILVALDGSGSGAGALQVAFQIANQHGAHLEGLGIVNSGWIQRPEPVPIGGIAIKAALDASRLATARERVDRVIQDFRERAANAGVPSYEARAAEGNPLELLAGAATAHDLVALGRSSMLDVGGEPYRLPVYVERIVREEPRPILLVPSEVDGAGTALDEKPILAAFDGSPAASRALHMFALLGLGKGQTVHVVIVADASGPAAANTARPCQLFERHGTAEARPIHLDTREGTPAETILGLAKSIGAGMIAMGAYGRSGIREIFGSTTREVLNHSPTVLFLHH